MKTMTLFATAAAALAFAASAQAQEDFPSKPVTLVVPFGAGGGTDNLVRTFQGALQEELGQTVVVENRPGGGSTIGTDLVTNADADGYTVLVVDTAITVNPALYDDLPYDALEDLDPVSMLATGPVILVAHPSSEASSVEELIMLAEENPDQLTFASGGNGSSTHLALELMQLETGIDVVHVPYRGSGPATTDLVGGHVDYMFNGISASKPHLESGALKALAVTGEERNPAVPEVPTFAELGYPEVNPMSIWGAWVPAGTDPAIVEQLSEAFSVAVNDPEVVEQLNALGYFTVGSSPEEYGERVRAETDRWGEVVDAAGITVD